VISIERVQELRSEVGEDDFEEIVALFVAESDSILGRLRSVGDPAEAEELLHALKGSALNLGFDTLAGLCRQGRGEAAGSAEWPILFDHLLEVYRQSKDRLAAIA
jgi:histidine phosphotransfer protein HptB